MMSRSTFLTTNEISSTNGLRFHHGLITPISSNNRSTEILPVVLQSSTMTESPTTHKSSIVRNNPKTKRNLRDKRRSTGIRPDEISLAGTSTDGSTNEENEEKDNVPTQSQFITITDPEPNESFDHNRTMPSSSPSKPAFTVGRIQSSFEQLTIPRTDPPVRSSSPSNIHPGATAKNFRPEEFILRRETTADESSAIKLRQCEEHILALESLVYDKEMTIHDLQRKLDKTTRDLTDAEQQICILHQDKLTLIKAFSALQDNKPSSGDILKRSNFATRI